MPPSGPWSWPPDPLPQLQNQGTGDMLRARSGAAPPHSGCSNHHSGDNTGQPSDPVREWGVMEKGNAPRRSAPTKHAALQRVRGTKNSHRDRLGRNSRIPRGVPTARGGHCGRRRPVTASLSRVEEEQARRARGRPAPRCPTHEPFSGGKGRRTRRGKR